MGGPQVRSYRLASTFKRKAITTRPVTTRIQHMFLVPATIAMLTACPSPPHESASSSADSASSPAPSASVGSTSQFALPPDVSARVELSKVEVVRGEPVTVRLVLHNRGPRDEELGLGSPEQRFDIVVVDSAEREVWSRLHHQDITLVRFVVPLRAKDSLVFAETWNQRDYGNRALTPGTYTVRGYVSPRTPGYAGVASAQLRVCAGSESC